MIADAALAPVLIVPLLIQRPRIAEEIIVKAGVAGTVKTITPDVETVLAIIEVAPAVHAMIILILILKLLLAAEEQSA